MSRGRMKRRRRSAWLGLGACWLALHVGCDTRAPRDPQVSKAPEPAWMVGERFPIGDARCRVESARDYLTEPKPAEGTARVAPDIHAVALALECEDERGRALRAPQALPEDCVILLITPSGERIAPTTRTWLSDAGPDRLVFELGGDEIVVSRTRRYDTSTGARQTQADRAFGRLWLRTSRQTVEVLLRRRAESPGFDAAVDRLMQALVGAEPAPAALGAAQQAHHAIVEYTGARRMAVTLAPSTEAAWPLLLTYDAAAEDRASPALTTLRLTVLPQAGAEGLRVEAVEELPRLERAIECARARRSLSAESAQGYTGRDASSDCHVLGMLVKGPCEAADPALVARAIEVMGRCIEPQTLRSSRLPPADFQLTLRRGRGSSALDRSPRYTLALFAAGAVVFHGRHWVNSLGRSDGRTDPRVLSGLYAHLLALDWFDRKGGEWSADACSADDDRGNVITLHAEGRERMILDREGCRGPFSAEELDTLRVLIESAAGLATYTQARPAYADVAARIWTVE